MTNLMKSQLFLAALAVVLAASAAFAAELTASERSLALAIVKQNPEVVDSSIKKKGDDLSLVLIVRPGTSPAKAKTLADNFVRNVKTFSKAEPNPGKEIGLHGGDTRLS